jgi:DUF1009 family protein
MGKEMKFKLQIERAHHLGATVQALEVLRGFFKKNKTNFTVEYFKGDQAMLERFDELTTEQKVRVLKSACLLKEVMWPVMTARVEVDVECP